MKPFDVALFRQQFPLLQQIVNTKPLIYFDNAATAQKPQRVIEALSDFYRSKNANVHRSSHALSASATQAFEQARVITQAFINAASIEEIIWTKGCTEAINLVANSWGYSELKTGDEIVLSYGEHHANIVPWQLVAKRTGAIIKILPLNKAGRIDATTLDTIISANTRIVCCAHVSNVLGRVNPIEAIIKRAKAVGAVTLIDGAQAVAHLKVDVQALNCDFYVFSAHKVYGPTGVGVLYGRKALLANMPPYQAGGEMIKTVSFEGTTFNDLPFKFEAGTPNIAGVIAFAQAIKVILGENFAALSAYEKQLTRYCLDKLRAINGVKTIVDGVPDIPVISFTIAGHHNHDIATQLDGYGIAIRSGHHCAMPLMHYLALPGCLRVSMAPYNTFAEVDVFIQHLTAIVDSCAQEKNAATTPLLANIALNSDDVLQRFAHVNSWDGRHREIMLLGKTLASMAKEHRTDDNLVAGCESLAWLTFSTDQQGMVTLTADSDARIIRGLLVIVLAAYNGKTSQQIQQFAINDYFDALGLLQHLSPSRGNGIRAIVNKILTLAV